MMSNTSNTINTILKNPHNGNSFELKSPLLCASGTFGYADEYEGLVDFNELGAIVTKGITLEKRPGNAGERIFECDFGLINRIGLENIGINDFINEKLPILKQKNINFILNIAGSTLEDYEKLSYIANENDIKALEVNVSCPNVKHGCLEFGLKPDLLFELVKKIRANYKGFLIVKLSPNTTDIKPLAQSAQSAGADCISAINTIRALGVKVNFENNKFNKKFVQGGLSGACIKPISLYMISQIKQVVVIPVIALGGIYNLNDLFEYISVGADAFQVGTANFLYPSIASDLAKALKDFMMKNGFSCFEELKKEILNG